MKSWKNGWPEYCDDIADDYQAITHLSNKVSRQLNVDINTEEGQKRTQTAIMNIAAFCRSNAPWSFKNVFWANLCFQNLYNHMKSIERLKKIRSNGYDYKK
jgi:hypothetical protein